MEAESRWRLLGYVSSPNCRRVGSKTKSRRNRLGNSKPALAHVQGVARRGVQPRIM